MLVPQEKRNTNTSHFHEFEIVKMPFSGGKDEQEKPAPSLPSLAERQQLQRKKTLISETFRKEITQNIRTIINGFKLLKEELHQEMPALELDKMINETKQAIINMQLSPAEHEQITQKTQQEKLGLSGETISRFFQVGNRYYLSKDYEKASSIFHILTFLNPYIGDYWLALGLSEQGQAQFQRALQAYAMSTIMNRDNPLPRYHAAEAYLAIDQFDDAKIEVEELKALISFLHLNGEWHDKVKLLEARLCK